MDRSQKYKKMIKEFFGFDLRKEQEKTLLGLEKSNVLSIMPTGSGKSMTYLIPTAFGKRTLVVSPLKSLIEDQYQSAKEFGLKSGFLSGQLAFLRTLKEWILKWGISIIFRIYLE